MTNYPNLAEHMACYLLAHPSQDRRLWAALLAQATPDLCRALADALGTDTMGESLARQLRSLALEKETTGVAR